MILLSDGIDSYGRVEENFKKLLNDTGKKDYIFSLHAVGYGNDHDAQLMYRLSRIKDGSFLAIRRLSSIQDVYLEIYGSLSTVNEVNITLKIQSNYKINEPKGFDELYRPSLINNQSNHFAEFTIIHYFYGKRMSFEALVDIPKNISNGTEVLNAKVFKLNLTAKYYYDGSSYSSYAYEIYVKYIVVSYF